MKETGKQMLFTLIGTFCFFNLVLGQVTSNSPYLPIETCGNTFPTSYFTLGDLVFSETSNNDFIAGTTTITINLPANFEFNTAVNPSLTSTGSNVTSLTVGTPAYADPQTLQINITIFGTSTVDDITIGGLQIRGITAVTATSNITYSFSATNPFNGLADGATVATVSSGSLTVTSGGTASSDQTLCLNATSALITIAGASVTSDPTPTPGETYQWQSSTDGTNFADIATGGTAIDFNPPNITESIYYRRRTILSRNGFSCSDVSTSVFLELNQVTAGAIIGNQTICEGTVASNLTQGMAASGSGTITYQWESDESGSWADIAGATNANYSPGAITTSTQYRRRDISDLGGVICTDHTNTVTATVLPAVVGGTAEVSAGVADQTVCSGTIPATISVTGSSGGTSYEWYQSIGGSPYTIIAGEVSATLTFAATPSETTYYARKSIANGTGLTCSAFSSASIVYVNNITAGSINGTQTICNGTNASVLTQNTAASATGTLSYQWESDASGSWADITGATSATYSPGAIASTTQYRRKDISTLNTIVCTEQTNTVTVTVLPTVVGGTAEVSAGVPDQTVCSWDIPATISVTGGSTGLSYQWQSSTDNITFTDIAGEVAENLTFAVAPSVTTYYRREATASGTGSTCSDVSTVSTVFVNQITPGIITGDQTICNGSTAAGITEDTGATHSGALTYEWESKVGAGAWSTIVGADLATYSPGAVTATTQYRRKDISTLNGEVCSDYTNTITITVLATVVGGTAEVSSGVADQTICAGDIPAAITVAGASGGTSFQWQSSTDNITFTDIAGEVGASLTFSASPVVTTYYQRVASAAGVGATCSGTSTVSTVFLNQISAGTIAGEQSICNGETASILNETAAASFSGTVTYQWESDESGSWADIVGATSATYAPGVLTKTIQYRRKDISTLNGEACSEYTNIVTVTVLAAATGGTAEVSVGVADQTICASDIPATIEVNGGAGGTGYQWQSSTDNVTFNNIPGEVAADLVFTVAPSQTNYYRRQTLNSGGGIDCPELSTVSTVFVNAITSGVIGNNQTICYNSLASNIIELSPAAPSGVLTQQWESKAGAGTWTAITGETDAGFSPGNLTQTTQYRRVDTSTLNGKVCFAYTNVITVEVLPEVAGGTSSADETLCADDIPSTITVTGAIGVSGQWQSSTDNINWTPIAGETGLSLTFTAPVTTTTYYRREVSTTINTYTCTDYSTTTVKTLNVMEAGTIGNDQTVCYGTILPNFSELAAANAAGALTYQWESKTETGAWTTIVGETDATYAPGVMTETMQYRRIDYSTLNTVVCSDITNEITITVSGEFEPGTASPATQTVCQGGDPAILTVTGGETVGVTYQWYSSTNGGATFNPLIGETSPTYNPPPGIMTSTHYYRETISDTPGTTCSDITAPVFVEVNTFDAGEILSTQTVCGGDTPATITSITGATAAGTITYSWESSTNLTTWTPIVNNQPTYSPGVLAQTTHFRRVATSNLSGLDCSVTSNISSVYVNQFSNDATHEVRMWYGSTGPVTVCFNTSPGEIVENFGLQATVGATISYQWQTSTDNSSWSDIAGANEASFEPPAVTADIFYRRISTTTLNGKACDVESNSIKFEVGGSADPGSVATSNPNSISASSLIEIVPYNTVPSTINNVTLGSGDGSNFRYLWLISTDGSNFIDAPGTNDGESYTPVDPVLQTSWFRRIHYRTYFSIECGVYDTDTEVQIIVPGPGTLDEDQTICINDDPALIESNTGTAEGTSYLSYQWESSTDNIVFNPIAGANSINYDPSAGQFTTTTYLRRVTNTIIDGTDYGTISYSETDIVTINVNTITPGTITGDQSICHNTTPNNITNESLPEAHGTATYEWWSSTDGTIYSIITGATASSYTFTAPLTQSTYYKRNDISTFNGLACSDFSNAVFVEVTEVQGGTVSAGQTVCTTDNPSPITVTGSVGAFGQWQDSIAGGTWTNIAGEQSTNLTFTAPISETTYYRRRAWSSFSGGSCEEYSDIATVNVNAISPGQIGSDQLLCYNSLTSNITVVSMPNGSGTITYQWEKNDTGTWGDIVGANQPTYSPGNLTTTTIFRRKDISTLNGVACSAYTNEVTIEILPEVQGGTTNGDQTVCSTDNPASIVVTGTLGTNKQWQSSANGTTGWTNIAGETGTSLAFAAPLAQTTYFRLRVWETFGALTCEEFSPVATIYVNEIVAGAIGSDQLLCYNSPVANLTVTAPASGSGVMSYQWEKNDTGTWEEILNATQPTYSPGALTTTTLFRRKAISTLYGDDCPLYSNEVTVEILPEVQGGTTNGDQTVCSTDNPANIVVTGALGTNKQWESSTDDGTTWNPVAGETGTTLAFSAPITETTMYRLHVWEVSGALTCEKHSPVVTLTLNEITPGQIGSDQVLCYNSTVANFSVVTPATGTGTISYQWEKDDSGTWEDIVGATQPTYSPGALTKTTQFRRKDISTVDGSPCSVYTNIVTVDIFNELVGGTADADQFVCLGEIPASISTDGIKGAEAIWQQSTDGATWTDVVGQNGVTLFFSAALTETTHFRWKTWTTLTCEDYSTVSTVNVNAIEPGEITADQTLCGGDLADTFTETKAAVSSGLLSHQWQSSTDLFNWNDIAGETSSTYGSSPAVTTYFRRKDISTLAGSHVCFAYTGTVKITVDEYPVIDDATIAANDITPVSCNGGNDGAINIPLSRITGGNVAQAQIVDIVLSGTPAVDDVYSLIINGTVYSHTVVLNALSNPQTNDEVAADLAAAISNPAVIVSVTGATIKLTAQTAGSPFTVFASTGASVNGKMTTQVVQENKLPNVYEWTEVGDPTVISTNLSISDLAGGYYQLLVSNAVCTDTAVFEVPEPEPLVIELDTTCNNSITVRISGGNENYEVTLIKPDASTEVKNTAGDVTFSDLIRGQTYTIEVVDAPCTQTFTKVATIPLGLNIDEDLITVTNIQCGGTDDGAISLDPNTITGGVEPYKYSWSIFDGGVKVQLSTDRDISGLAPDTYYLDVEDNIGCTAEYSTTIDNKDPITVTSTATKPVLDCPGDATASIDINVSSDPTSVLEINWFKDGVELPALQNQLSIIDLVAGKYHVEVVDISVAPIVCMVADTTEITEPAPFTVTEEAISETPACFSESYKGSITYKVTGGTEPYSYQLDGAASIDFTPDENGFVQIANLDTGDHVIEFFEFYNCSPGAPINFRIESPEPIEITYDEDNDVVDVGCSIKGSIKVNVTGGTAPFFYEWVGPNNFAQSGTGLNQVNNLEEIGIYTLIVTDINQCKSEEINIELVELTTDFEVVEVIRNGECASNGDASIELTVSNIVVPYTVEWEKWDLINPDDPDCVTDCYSWQPMPAVSGQLTMDNLGPGEYRVTIIDGSNSLCDTYVQTFSLASSSIEMFDNAVRLPDCEDSDFGYAFRMKADNSLKFYLDGTEISLTSGSLIYNSFNDQYIIKNIEPGDHLLRVVEELPSGDEGCDILQNFTVGEFTALAYTGATSHELDVCTQIYTFTLDTSLVEGGVPFEDTDGNTFYNYEWTAPDNSVINGFNEVPVSIGIYQLVIKDQRGCSTDPILFNFNVSYNEIEVFEEIQNVSCDENVNDGSISVNIQGGREPYSITWEKEIVSPANGETTYSIVDTDVRTISDLASGRYKLTVLSDFDNCDSNNPIVRYEALYIVNKDESVTILDGPYLSPELCGGTPGFLTIQVTEINTGSTLFYYDEKLVNANFIGEGTYEVYIDSPVSNAILNAVNESGCGAFVILEDGVANPSFRYESEGFLQFGITGVGEEIEFINTTTDVYDSLTWDFGDGSDILPLSLDQEKIVDVIHSYKTEGEFDVTLTVFNAAGCSNEVQNKIVIGKGYNVMFPTAFTPNGDGINDYFEGGFTGIVAFTLNIYDTWNNLIFTTSHETANLPEQWGWNGTREDGTPFNSQVFKYIFYGTRLNQEVIIVTDNAIIVK